MSRFPMLAGFNAWANRRLYGACAELSEAAYRQDRGAFFGSIHNTLNHLLVVDRLWLGRLEGVDSGVASLDQVLCDDLPALRAAREREDARLVAYVAGLDTASLDRPVAYRFLNGEAATTPLDIILITLFNHQTHHRGQVHNMLSQAGIDPPALDVIDYLD